jgi:hypothetical protein
MRNLMTVEEGKDVCKDRSKWKEVISAYPKGKRAWYYVCMYVFKYVYVMFKTWNKWTRERVEAFPANNPNNNEELDGPAVGALQHAIAKAKQRWSVIGWVTKNSFSRAPPCFGKHVKHVSTPFAVVSTHQSVLGLRGGLWPLSPYVWSIR